MEDSFQQGVWIWCCTDPLEDEYGEFAEHFYYEKGRALLRIASDSNYAAYINGRLAAWGQYADFPYDKVYDQIDVTEYCRPGENRLAILVWYYGTDTTQVYAPGKAGLLFELACGGRILCHSSERTLARLSRAYQSHRRQRITSQLGWSFFYDATREDQWLLQEAEGFGPAVEVPQRPPLRIRPCRKLELLREVEGREYLRINDCNIIFDLGRETVGFLSFQLSADCQQEIVISYGEHLADGCVRRRIDDRDFSVAYRARQGENVFLNPFRRLACRYLQVQSKTPLQIRKMAVAPTMYGLTERQRPVLTDVQGQIYQMCVETLKLCMHEHYEDCPWREQALYTMDSRNQMLCGYYAFGEYQFPRANLQLISKDRRKDGLLSICFPMKNDFVIPSFTLHYITECREYLEYSGDGEFIDEIFPKLVSCLEPFLSRMPEGLALPFAGDNYWNFYEWRAGLDGTVKSPRIPDLILNCLLSLALGHMAHMTEILGKENDYGKRARQLNRRIHEAFWEEAEGRFYDLPLWGYPFEDSTSVPEEASDHTAAERGRSSQLGNALAVLCGAVQEEEAARVCEHLLQDSDMTPISLSMQCFKYDAWLKVDRQRYGPVILADIERIYLPMVQSGGTTVWETELGEADFGRAGSLCHGWSAMPVYYYHILEKPCFDK